MRKTVISIAIGLSISGAAVAVDDFGLRVQNRLQEDSLKYFGVLSPIGASETITVPRKPGQSALDLIKLAPGLSAKIVTRKSANNSDMMAFWPSETNPSHIVTCIEAGNAAVSTFPSGQPKLTPSVQTVNLATGEVKTILRGMTGCDGIRRTPWNTIVVTEEVDDGGLYEILNPLTMPDLTLVVRGASAVVDTNGAEVAPGQVKYRGAVGKLAWEGLDLTNQGVVYYGDEERPGTGGTDFDGGSLFKFVPELQWDGKLVTDLSQSPLGSGSIYAYQASCQARMSNSFPQFGQGCEIGDGAWVKIDPENLRTSAFTNGATGFYRPEDGHFDPMYKGAGVKFCWTNTGNSSAQNYGEVVCLIDTNPAGGGEKKVDATGLTYLADSAELKGFAVAVANRAVEGDADLNQPDNLAFQPVTGNMYVIEDNAFGDVWSCLSDGKDRDIKTDGCVKMLSVRDSSAEPTGFAFTADGKTAYAYIQHSNDAACVDGTDCAKNDDYATDDLIKITGFKLKVEDRK